MMTNYDVLVNSSEEECCKLLEEWKEWGTKDVLHSRGYDETMIDSEIAERTSR